MATKLKVNYEFVGDSTTPVTRTNSIKHGDKMLDTVINNLEDYVTPQMFGAKGDGLTDDTDAIKSAIEYAVNNKVDAFIPKGVYLITHTILLTAPIEGWATPSYEKAYVRGDVGSVIKASSGFADTVMFDLGGAGGDFYRELIFEKLKIDGNGKNITLIKGTSNKSAQPRFTAYDSYFGNIHGVDSIAFDTTSTRLVLRNCIIQGSGDYTTNGIAIKTGVSNIDLESTFITYFNKAIYVANRAESTLTARGCYIQYNRINVFFEGLTYTPIHFDSCGFVESRPGCVHFAVSDTSASNVAIAGVNLTSCVFDGFNDDTNTPLIDLRFGSVSARFTFSDCTAWLIGSYGMNPLRKVKIGNNVTATFNNCFGFFVESNINQPKLNIQDYMANTAYRPSVSGNNIRPFTAVMKNNIASATVDVENSTFTLFSGVYDIEISAQCNSGGNNFIELKDITHSTTPLRGLNFYSPTNGSTYATLKGTIVVEGYTTFNVNHNIQTAYEYGLSIPNALGQGPNIVLDININQIS